jgi:hypothetical protein
LVFGFHKLGNAPGRFNALGGLGDQRHADAPGTGIAASYIARKVAARQHCHIVKSEQVAREIGIAALYLRPQVKAGVG